LGILTHVCSAHSLTLRLGVGVREDAGGREGPECEDLRNHCQEFGFTLRMVGSIEVIVAGASCDRIRLLCEEWKGVLI